MSKVEIKREAVERQGRIVRSGGREFRIEGDNGRAIFRAGGEGLVHLATEVHSGIKYRIKCFWDPTQARYTRSEKLVEQQLADLGKSVADALGGAPFEILTQLGPNTPFAVVMKDVKGFSWRDLKERAVSEKRYPPLNWPSIEVRAVWAYGLATAVRNMEARGFIHADLSDGNVMVTPTGGHSGDMALVDFDSFIHPSYPHLDSTTRGTPGYAAPETWNSTSVMIGSDRIGMAILIQEFLVYGDPGLTADEAAVFLNGYEQENDICRHTGEVFPLFAQEYPQLAILLERTLRASEPRRRPEPELWRAPLKLLASGHSLRRRLVSVSLEASPVERANLRLAFGDTQSRLELQQTGYGIRARLERHKNGSIDAVVTSGATIHSKIPGAEGWKMHSGGDRVPILPDTILFDPQGKSNVRIRAREV